MKKYFEINEKGHNIRCKLYCNDPRNIRKAVLSGTGFAGHKDNRATEVFAEKLLSKQKNAAVFVFDWPCHGDDVKKKLTLSDCFTYMDLVIQEIRARYGVEDLCAYATSFGAWMFLLYLSERGNPFRKLAFRCPVVDMYGSLTGTVIRKGELELLQKGREALVGFDRKVPVTEAFLEELKEHDIRKREFLDYADDILILHGTADEVVPFESVRRFSEDNVIELVPVEGADHRFQNPLLMSLANKYVMQFFGFLPS